MRLTVKKNWYRIKFIFTLLNKLYRYRCLTFVSSAGVAYWRNGEPLPRRLRGWRGLWQKESVSYILLFNLWQSPALWCLLYGSYLTAYMHFFYCILMNKICSYILFNFLSKRNHLKKNWKGQPRCLEASCLDGKIRPGSVAKLLLI